MTHTGLDASTNRDGAMIHGEDEKNNWAWLGGLRWPVTVAYGRACDSGSGQNGLVMAFMSTMVLGLKRREQTREKKIREGNEIMRKEEREELVR